MKDDSINGMTLPELEDEVQSIMDKIKLLAQSISDVKIRIEKLTSDKNNASDLYRAQLTQSIQMQSDYLENLNVQKSKLHSMYDTALSAYNDKKNAHNQFLQRNNSHSIAEIIKDHRESGEAGYTAIYRADLKENAVFFVSEESPTEQSSFDVPTHSVDHDDPRTNYVNENSRQLSGTYWLFGDDLNDCSQKYDSLLNMAKSGVKFAIDGFSKWNTANIASLQKTTDGSVKNALQLSIQFNFAKDAFIQTARDITPKPPAPPIPPPAPPKPDPPGVWVRINPGDTYWRAMTIYGTSIAQLEAWNPWEAHVLPIGGMMRVK